MTKASLIPAAALLFLILPLSAAAQPTNCMVTNTTIVAPMQVRVSIHFSGPGTWDIVCTNAAMNNAICDNDSYRTGTMSSHMRQENGIGTGTNPSCSWKCGGAAGGKHSCIDTVHGSNQRWRRASRRADGVFRRRGGWRIRGALARASSYEGAAWAA